MLWCRKDPKHANHEPSAVLNGDRSRRVLTLRAKAGERVRLSARGSTDPDGDRLSYRWYRYPETLGPATTVAMDGAESAEVSLAVPPVEGELHVILEVRDPGAPSLASYRRLVIRADSDFDASGSVTPRAASSAARFGSGARA